MELNINNLVKEFGSFDDPSNRVVAVDHVNLSVGEGELVTLLGPSGCGKTTLLRMIAGFEDPTSGDVFFGEERVNNVAPNQRNATMVFQSYAIFPHLNVYENIAFGLRLKKIKEKEIEEKMEQVIDLVGLTGLESRQPSQLSGGQQQRVALARAIVMEPALLLFDEPLSNLDAKLREQMRIEIRNLQKRLGITSVYVTHDQAEAMSISDRIVVMNKGRIVQIGTPFDLYARPANSFVAAFIGKVNFMPVRIKDKGCVQIGGATLQVTEMPSGCSVDDTLIAALRPESLIIDHITEESNIYDRGRIIRRTFLGTIIEYEIEVHNEYFSENLIVHTVNPMTPDLFEIGETVSIRCKEEAIHILCETPDLSNSR